MLPQDPNILLSMINMKLRDHYKSLDDLCDDLDEDKSDIIIRLGNAGYKYNENTNQFV